MLLDLILYTFFYLPTFSLLETKQPNPINANISYYADEFDKNKNKKIIKHSSSNMADSGGAQLFMVHSPDQSFVIKLEKPKNIVNEANALLKLKDLEISPKLMGQGEFLKEQDPTGVLIESFVEGKSLHYFLQKLGRAKTPLSYLIHKYRLHSALKSFAQKLNIFHSINSKPIHNDLHPGNIFYNPDQNKTTLIDLELASFNKQNAEEDIAYFLLTFEMYASKYKLKEKTLKSLKRSFLDNYKIPLDQTLIEKYREIQIKEFKEYLDANGCDEEKKLLLYLDKL